MSAFQCLAHSLLICAVLSSGPRATFAQAQRESSADVRVSARQSDQEAATKAQNPVPPQQDQRQQPSERLGPLLLPQGQNSGQGTLVIQPGNIVGNVVDVNDDAVPGATVVLQGPVSNDRRTVATNDNGFFEIHDVKPGISYQIIVSAPGFTDWTSPVVILEPGQYKILTASKLRLEEVQTTVTVSPESSLEIATEQVKVEEKQRGFGFVPNFFAVYDPNPAPLTTKLKFRLAFRAVRDPITVAGAAMLAGAGQSAKTPIYGAHWNGFGERFGATYANQFTDFMIGGAILPSLLHQDPRYFYQGTGTKKSRALHAISTLFITKGDDGHWQPNYSRLGGDLASAAVSNAYYPEANRGAALVFENFAIHIAAHMSFHLLQEFVFRP
jgi:hypothetical protein